MEELTLVDNQDNVIGHAEKMHVHRCGLLHRAFSIFVFDEEGRLLLQRRALGKYHSQGLWSNTCCGHPRYGENTLDAAARRLNEEMGLKCDVLTEVHAFIYRAAVTNQLTEHEYDHILVGMSAFDPVANHEEALDWKWVTLNDLERDMTSQPSSYTAWFQMIVQQQGIAGIKAWRDGFLCALELNQPPNLLAQIDSPKDLHRLHRASLAGLAAQLREFVLQSVAATGGHLSANLGTIELTIALHYVFEAPVDRIVWDVGHQAYAHKILTGRRRAMSRIRQSGGISGFPRRQESEFDCFGTAHASTSLSAALGMAIATRYKGESRHCVAVIGDGALSGGIAFEALNNAGTHSHLPFLVILNDNNMSISAPVGSLSEHLRLLSQDGQSIPTFFQALGFEYTGPIDGHDLDQLIPALQACKNHRGPQLLHVVTVKGNGYPPAARDPVLYHGPGRFDPGRGIEPVVPVAPTYADVVGQWVCEEAEADSRVVAISPAMCEGSGLVTFQRRFAGRCFDVGIAEQHALTFAAGLAVEGLKPVVVIYSTFLQRAYDQLIHDIAIQHLPVVLAVDRAGVVGADGATHTGAFDIAYLRCVPGLVLMAPADENECRQMLHAALMHDGPSAVRYPRGQTVGVPNREPLTGMALGRAEMRRLSTRLHWPYVAILAFGSVVAASLEAATELDATLANMRFIKPLDHSLLEKLARGHNVLVTVEEGCIKGGAGSACLEYLASVGLSRPTLQLGFADNFVEHATPEQALEQCGLDAKGIASSITTYLQQLRNRGIVCEDQQEGVGRCL